MNKSNKVIGKNGKTSYFDAEKSKKIKELFSDVDFNWGSNDPEKLRKSSTSKHKPNEKEHPCGESCRCKSNTSGGCCCGTEKPNLDVDIYNEFKDTPTEQLKEYLKSEFQF